MSMPCSLQWRRGGETVKSWIANLVYRNRLAHVRELANKLGCEVWWAWHSLRGLAVHFPNEGIGPYVLAPNPTTGWRYATNLHELGHIALGHTGSEWIAVDERAAWEWAVACGAARPGLWDGWAQKSMVDALAQVATREEQEDEDAS